MQDNKMDTAFIEERYELSEDRIKEIAEININSLADENVSVQLPENYHMYFKRVAEFICMLMEEYTWVADGSMRTAELEELKEHNHKLYEDILPKQYEKSYANPAYAVAVFGEDYGRLLSFLYTEMRSLIVYAYEQKKEDMLIRIELFLEVYQAFTSAYEETGKQPEFQELQQIIYWFVSDYSETQIEERVREQLDPTADFATAIIKESKGEDLRYLYYFGEYITENELRTAKHIWSLSEEKLALMADTFTEGYRIGFVVGGKDLSKKKVVNIRYTLGFERMMKRAIDNFAHMGLQPTIYRAAPSLFHRRGTHLIGYFGAIPNKQYQYDHKEDEALYFDKMFMNRRLEVLKAAYEQYKELAYVHAGPACLDVFGETPFAPQSKTEAYTLTQEQQKLSVAYASASGQLVNEYIKGEERSFTIIAFPVPEIGDNYEEIFDEVIRINTLDYKLYQNIQQTIIDTLDKAEKVHIKGCGSNCTDLTVALYHLANPEKETIFENCVADVNIPVGEVFTSPVLEGTNGTLYVSKVFLNELEYRDLKIVLQDGMVTDYSCSNFENDADGKKYIKDNILYHHDTLPLGEFAIGTNTTAYVVSKRYDIADKLPILIAEKMGPHFALGDTCYSHSEEVRVYNPDGKEIVAKDNTCSLKRNEDMSKAYFNCHTDITIPYDELGELCAIQGDGTRIPIIENGRFVLAGCEELNKPFEMN